MMFGQLGTIFGRLGAVIGGFDPGTGGGGSSEPPPAPSWAGQSLGLLISLTYPGSTTSSP